MIAMQNLLERTSLKAIGTFLLSDDVMWNLGQDIPADILIRGKYDDFIITLRKAGFQESPDILQALQDVEDAAESVGFYAGLKAGARLVLALTDSGELLC